jgi:hypothetical protein
MSEELGFNVGDTFVPLNVVTDMLTEFGYSLQASPSAKDREFGEALVELVEYFEHGKTVGEHGIFDGLSRIATLLAVDAELALLAAPVAYGASYALTSFLIPLVGAELAVALAPAFVIAMIGYGIFKISDYLADFLYEDIISPLISFLSDPLVLDLDSDGIELTALTTSTTHFDLNANGFAEHTGWVAPDDGLLVIDRNRNNRVDSVAELFGSATQDGFAVLETLDDNHDGIINTADAAFADLKVWRDLNQNGVSEAGELFTLSALGIQSISVQTQHATGVNQGHSLGVTAQFTRQNGTAGKALDKYTSILVMAA